MLLCDWDLRHERVNLRYYKRRGYNCFSCHFAMPQNDIDRGIPQQTKTNSSSKGNHLW